jgi:hypothetical protein
MKDNTIKGGRGFDHESFAQVLKDIAPETLNHTLTFVSVQNPKDYLGPTKPILPGPTKIHFIEP